MLLLVALAAADTSASSFSSDAGDWDGGVVENGVLRLDDTTATLDVGELTSFEFSARMRLAAGEGFTVSLGDSCTFSADYAGKESIGFGGSSQPFPVSELTFVPGTSPALSNSGGAEALGVSDPDVVFFNGEWWLFYTATDASNVTSVRAATSTDLTNWTRKTSTVLSGASQPAAVVVSGELLVYYTSGGQIWRTSSGDGQSFEFPTVVLSPGTGFDAPGLGHPSVLVDDATWRLWYSVPSTGASGSATSSDGSTFTRDTQMSTDNSRLFGVDVADADLGLEGVYTLLDSVGFAQGGNDTNFADDTRDLRPLLAMNDTSWSEGGFGTASVVRNGHALHLFVDASHDGTRILGQIDSRPLPGTFGTLTLSWDGTEVDAAWSAGPSMSCTMSSFSGITVTADGRAEIDEASLSYAGRSTGDSADTAAIDDEDPNDTANGGVDSGEPGLNAGEWLGEPGGCGCSTPPMTRGMAFLLLPLLLLVARRRSTRPA